MSIVAVGLSGGIDSGTTALMLKEQGYEVFGVTMWLFDHQHHEIEAAKKVAAAIGIPHHVLDYRNAFKEKVITPFIDAYEFGRTPNPCLYCNKHFKYGQLISDCIQLGADFFATGHYVKCEFDTASGEYILKKAGYEKKDQSYNLYHLDQNILSKLIFPLGFANSKEEVRAHFSKLNVTLSQKKDSLGICFIAHKNHRRFLKEVESSSSIQGDFINLQGEVLGTHSGFGHYTIGQKRRLGMGRDGQYLNGRYVVVAIHPETNHVVLGNEDSLLYNEVFCSEFNLISPSLKTQLSNDTQGISITAVLSQWSEKYQGKLFISASGARVSFETPVRAPSQGQAMVCYKEDVLIGGGIISAFENTK